MSGAAEAGSHAGGRFLQDGGSVPGKDAGAFVGALADYRQGTADSGDAVTELTDWGLVQGRQGEAEAAGATRQRQVPPSSPGAL